MTQDKKDYLYKHLPLIVSIISTTAVAVFLALNYINLPVNKIELEIALIQKDIQIITEEHIKYAKISDDQATAIIEINRRLERIQTLIENNARKK